MASSYSSWRKGIRRLVARNSELVKAFTKSGIDPHGNRSCSLYRRHESSRTRRWVTDPNHRMENYMKLLIPSIAALAFSAASLSAGAALKPSDLFLQPAPSPSPPPAILTAAPTPPILTTDDT